MLSDSILQNEFHLSFSNALNCPLTIKFIRPQGCFVFHNGQSAIAFVHFSKHWPKGLNSAYSAVYSARYTAIQSAAVKVGRNAKLQCVGLCFASVISDIGERIGPGRVHFVIYTH